MPEIVSMMKNNVVPIVSIKRIIKDDFHMNLSFLHSPMIVPMIPYAAHMIRDAAAPNSLAIQYIINITIQTISIFCFLSVCIAFQLGNFFRP